MDISSTQKLPVLGPTTGTQPAGTRTGSPLPPGGNSSPPPPAPSQVESAVNRLNAYLSESGQKVNLGIAWANGQPVIKAVNLDSGEVRAMHADEVLRLAAALARDGRHTFDTLA